MRRQRAPLSLQWQRLRTGLNIPYEGHIPTKFRLRGELGCQCNHRNDWGASGDVFRPNPYARASERRGHPIVILLSGYIQSILITKFTVTFRSMWLSNVELQKHREALVISIIHAPSSANHAPASFYVKQPGAFLYRISNYKLL